MTIKGNWGNYGVKHKTQRIKMTPVLLKQIKALHETGMRFRDIADEMSNRTGLEFDKNKICSIVRRHREIMPYRGKEPTNQFRSDTQKIRTAK